MFTMQNAIEERWIKVEGFVAGYWDGIEGLCHDGKYHNHEAQAYDRGYQGCLQTQRTGKDPSTVLDEAWHTEPPTQEELFEREIEAQRAERRMRATPRTTTSDQWADEGTADQAARWKNVTR